MTESSPPPAVHSTVSLPWLILVCFLRN